MRPGRQRLPGPEGRMRMNSTKNTARALEDVKVNVKTKLSGLWVALMFFYVYNDVISFFRRDTIEDVLSG
jgi:hypothetical protein